MAIASTAHPTQLTKVPPLSSRISVWRPTNLPKSQFQMATLEMSNNLPNPRFSTTTKKTFELAEFALLKIQALSSRLQLGSSPASCHSL